MSGTASHVAPTDAGDVTVRSGHDGAASQSSANPPTDPVAAALASGVWREKMDRQSGKKYYVNTKTKKSTWNLAKLLAKGTEGGGPVKTNSARKSDAMLREERHERARQRVEAETVLANQISQLEQSKVELEAEVARLKAPVEAEQAKLAELRQLVADKRFTIDAVHREALQRRQARDAELRSIMHNVTNLQSVVDSDTAFKESVDARHRQLLVESMELSSDLDKERSAAEALQLAVREAERSFEIASEKLKAQEADIRRKEELVELAEADLEHVARRVRTAETEISELEQEKKRLVGKAVKANRIAAVAAEHSKAGDASVAQLTEQYQAKVRTLETLSQLERREDDALALDHGNGKLRALIQTAQRDANTLERLAQMLDAETKRVLDVVSIARADCSKVAKSLAEVERGEESRQKQLRAAATTVASTL
jgi:chromosome segregation ATPase